MDKIAPIIIKIPRGIHTPKMIPRLVPLYDDEVLTEPSKTVNDD